MKSIAATARAKTFTVVAAGLLTMSGCSERVMSPPDLTGKPCPDDITLSADIFAGPYYGPQYLPQMQEPLDFVNLMAFDFTGAWDGSDVSHHADFPMFRLAMKGVEGRGFWLKTLLSVFQPMA